MRQEKLPLHWLLLDPHCYLFHKLQWHIRVHLQVTNNKMIWQRHHTPELVTWTMSQTNIVPQTLALLRFTINSWCNLRRNNDLRRLSQPFLVETPHHLIEELISANDSQV